MPYIVTTKENAAIEGHEAPGMRYFERRRAVATLDEAWEHLRTNGLVPMDANMHDLGAPIEGGTVGPLPDGTVIEVERVEWGDLTEYAVTRAPDALATTLIAAYNAAQD